MVRIWVRYGLDMGWIWVGYGLDKGWIWAEYGLDMGVERCLNLIH